MHIHTQCLSYAGARDAAAQPGLRLARPEQEVTWPQGEIPTELSE